MTHHRRTIRRAFTLMEVLMAISLLTIFFFAAGEIFRSTVILSSEAPQLSDRSAQIDSALYQLRRDVWNSPQISTPTAKSAEIESPQIESPQIESRAQKITWTIDQTGNLTRTDPLGKPELWKSIAKNWSLHTNGPSIKITDGSAEITIPSQILLSHGANP